MTSSQELVPYADEPLADNNWLSKYESEEKKQRREDLENRLVGNDPVETW